MIAIPMMLTHELKVFAISISEKFIATHEIRGEESQVNLYSVPSVQLVKSIVISNKLIGKVKQLELVKNYLLVIKDIFQAFSLPDLQLVFSSDISPISISSDKNEVALLLNKRVIIFSLDDFLITSEFDLKNEYKRAVILSQQGILLQSKYTVNYLDFNNKERSENCLFELKKSGIKGILNLEQPAANIIHIQQYSLVCITSNNCTFFVDYNFRQYVRYPSIKHLSEPFFISFLHPCYILAFYMSSVSIFLIHTGEALETLPMPILYHDISSTSVSCLFIASQSNLISFISPALDLLIPSILSNQRFDVALEICKDTCHSLISRVYFEHGVHMFFTERDYQRASYYFRKSEEIWAICSLLRKILVLPPIVFTRCEEQFSLASNRISKYSILPSQFELITHKRILSFDSALKTKIIQSFIPFFSMIRKIEEENLKFFSECWLFSAYLYLPGYSVELLGLLRDPSNSLPLRYCEVALKSLKRYEEITELFLARKIYKAGLEGLFSKYEEEKTKYWLILAKEFLMNLTSNPDCFIEYLQRLFCESTEQAEYLLLAYPKILEQVDVLNILIPIMFKYSGTLLVINFLRGRDLLGESNFLAKLYIQETMEGNVNPKELVAFLSSRPIKYDPNVVLTYFPKNLLQREKCLVLDLLGKYEEIIHYYLYTEKNMEIAKKYVEHKRNPEVSSIFITKICKSPMSREALLTLTCFLNEADPNIIDHNLVFTFIPQDLQLSQIEKYLNKAFYFMQEEKRKIAVKKNIQEKYLVDLIATYFLYADKSVEIHDDSRCDLCSKKIKTQDFIVTLKHEILHLSCFEK